MFFQSSDRRFICGVFFSNSSWECRAHGVRLQCNGLQNWSQCRDFRKKKMLTSVETGVHRPFSRTENVKYANSILNYFTGQSLDVYHWKYITCSCVIAQTLARWSQLKNPRNKRKSSSSSEVRRHPSLYSIMLCMKCTGTKNALSATRDRSLDKVVRRLKKQQGERNIVPRVDIIAMQTPQWNEIGREWMLKL